MPSASKVLDTMWCQAVFVLVVTAVVHSFSGTFLAEQSDYLNNHASVESDSEPILSCESLHCPEPLTCRLREGKAHCVPLVVWDITCLCPPAYNPICCKTALGIGLKKNICECTCRGGEIAEQYNFICRPYSRWTAPKSVTG